MPPDAVLALVASLGEAVGVVETLAATSYGAERRRLLCAAERWHAVLDGLQHATSPRPLPDVSPCGDGTAHSLAEVLPRLFEDQSS